MHHKHRPRIATVHFLIATVDFLICALVHCARVHLLNCALVHFSMCALVHMSISAAVRCLILSLSLSLSFSCSPLLPPTSAPGCLRHSWGHRHLSFFFVVFLFSWNNPSYPVPCLSLYQSLFLPGCVAGWAGRVKHHPRKCLIAAAVVFCLSNLTLHARLELGPYNSPSNIPVREDKGSILFSMAKLRRSWPKRAL